ncbi:MAG: amino acid adenylation domain-containing protein [Betaproteobacteria bacterium]
MVAPQEQSIPRGPRRETAETSFAQERIWFLHQLDPGSPSYNRPAAARLRGRMDVSVLRRSLNEIMRRHEVLRAVFPSAGGFPSQVIVPCKELDLPVIKLGGRTAEERDAAARRFAVEESCRPFDLAAGPLVRPVLLQLSEDDHVLLLATHHMVFDGASQEILWREMMTLYEDFSKGMPSSLPELPIQYADFSSWQRRRVQGELFASQLAYWRRTLEGAPPPTELPADRLPSSTRRPHGAKRYRLFPKSLAQSLKDLRRREEVTLFRMLLAAFTTLLYRYTGQDDIVVLAPASGRVRLETETLIGCFINTLVLRTDLSDDPTFRELARRTRDVVTGALGHQELPFEKLVEKLHSRRDFFRSPFSQVMFQLRRGRQFAGHADGLALELFDCNDRIVQVDLALEMEEQPDGFLCAARYNADLYDVDTIDRLLGSFQTLLEAIAACPDSRVSTLALLTHDERDRYLIRWNRTQSEYPRERCIHQLVEAQAARTPDAIAVMCEDRQLTYRELNRRADRLARHLRANGVVTESAVAICVERSEEVIVGVLAILKAGGAYVPLDPSYPKERLSFMLQDCEAKIVLADEETKGLFSHHPVRVVCPDFDWGPTRRDSDQPVACDVTAQNLAYLIYTSGSTGLPKGVEVEHRSVVNVLLHVRDLLELSECDRMLAITTLSFDISVLEIFLPLMIGARTIVVKRDVAMDARALGRTISSTDATVVQATPATFRMLLDAAWEGGTHLKLLSGGEALPRDLANGLRKKCGRLWNGYGPTETTIYSTLAEIEPGTESIVIGRPIANAQIYILDRGLTPVPVGVVGELFIGGDGLARGYRKRPEVTAEHFVANPFSQDANARLYRTGDLARYCPDGRVQCLGRTDHQVKIRGFRIEPEEIEAMLEKHPVVEKSLVVAREHPNGDTRLVAYVVPRRGDDVLQEGISWADWQDEQVSQWRHVWEEAFSLTGEASDPTCNTAGVNSSYTGEPVPAAEARDWVEQAAARILSLKPNRVLEIGCGLGRILFRVAPHCSAYCGTDFSPTALSYIQRHLHLLGEKARQVSLVNVSADALGRVQQGRFDTIVLNGVVQYFPNLDFFLRVLREALKLMEPGGVIFIGDVRSLRLLEAFRLSVELHKTSEEMSEYEFRRRLRNHVVHEEELLIDPAFFAALGDALQGIASAEVLLKRGRAQNELTRFRYDVILHIGSEDESEESVTWLDWETDQLTVADVRRRLMEDAVDSLGITAVPNARVWPEVGAVADFGAETKGGSVSDLRIALDEKRAEAIHPEDFWSLAEETPFSVDITWSGNGDAGRFDVLMRRRTTRVADSQRRVPARFQRGRVSPKPMQSHANDPLRMKLDRALISQIRSLAEKHLPSYMIPSAFVVLDGLPLTPNRKVDRKNLPAPDPEQSRTETRFVAPRAPTETALAEIWCELLGLKQVGVHDGFFELGGHSLLATQVISRIRECLHVEVPLRTLFEEPTIHRLASIIDQRSRGGAQPPQSNAPLVRRRAGSRRPV